MTNALLKKRENWIDLIKGISALFVMLAHVSGTPMMYRIFYSYIMLPVFFFASGYLTKEEQPLSYLYNRVLKLFILYVMYSIITFFVSVERLLTLFKNPIGFLQLFCDCLKDILNGQSLWFIACLIITSLIFIIIKSVTNNNHKLMAVMSSILFVLALVFSVPGRKFWNIDTACVCQFFFVVGYIAKQRSLFSKISHINRKILISGIVYIALIYSAYYFFGETAVAITVGTNEWKLLAVTIPALIIGNVFILLLAKKIDKLPLINYIGSHALIYYAFASHGLSVFSKILKLVGLYNPYLLNVLVVLLTAIVMAVVCRIIDRFFPILNGKFKLPKFK